MMNKKIVIKYIFLSTLILLGFGVKASVTSPIFNVSANGLTLTIAVNFHNKTYNNIGIKLNSNEYGLAHIGSECTLNSNGYCLFTVSSAYPKNITLSGSEGKLSLTLCLNGQGPASCQQYMVTIDPAWSFSGVRTDLTESEILQGGFEQCYHALYSSILDNTASAIQIPCTGDVLVMACRPVGATTYTVAAMALRSEIFLDVPANSTASRNSNGAQWYYSNNYSLGFAPLGATISRDSCDTYTTSENTQRLCWHVDNKKGGYRCGSTIALNSSVVWERVVYHRNGSL